MDGATLLTGLQNDGLKDAPNIIKDYLAPVFQDGSNLAEKNKKIYSYYAFAYQRTLAGKIDNFQKEQVIQATDCILDCFNCERVLKVAMYWAPSRKAMGHVITKLAKKNFPKEVITLARALHEDLCLPGNSCEPQDTGIDSLANNVYAALWNAAILAERQNEEDFALPFEYRSLALNFLAIGQTNLASLTSKFRITLERLPIRGNEGLDIHQNVMHLFRDISSQIKLFQDVSDDAKVEGTIDVFVHLLKYLWLNSLTVEAETTARLFQDFVSMGAPVLGISAKDIDILNICACLIELVKSIIVFKASQNAQKKNVVYKNELSGSLQNCRGKMSLLASSVNSKTSSVIFSGLANCCSLSVDCLSKTVSSCKPEMKSLLSNNLFELYKIQAQLSDQEKAMWLYKGVDNLSKVETRRLEAVSLDSVISLSKRISILVEKIYEADGVKKELVMPYLTRCEEEMDKLYHRVLSEVDHPDRPLPIRQCYELGNLAHRVGRSCHRNGWLNEAITFLKISCHMFQKSNSSGEAKLLVQLWKRGCKGLVDAQRRNGEFVAAIDSIIKGVIADPSNLADAAKYWAAVKYDISKSEKESPMLQRTLCESLREHPDFPETLLPMALLEAELKAYKDHFGQIPSAQLAVIELILSNSEDPGQKASALLDKALIFWGIREGNKLGTPVSFCHDAKQLLEAAIGTDEKKTPLNRDLLAKANLLTYVVQTVDPVSIQAIALEQIRRQKTKVKSNDPSSSQDKDDGESYDICCTLNMERGAMTPVETALQLWEQCAAVDSTSECYPSSTTDMLLVASNIFQLTQRTTLHLRALKAASVLCSRTADPDKYLSVQTAQIEAMCRLKQPDQALQLTKMTDSWLKTNKLDSLKEDVLFIYYLAAKSSAFFIAGKIQESYKLVVEAQNLQRKICRLKSKDWMMTESALCLIEYKFRELPKSVLNTPQKQALSGPSSAGRNEATALEMLTSGLQQVSGVVSYVLGEWVMNKTKAENFSKVPCNVLEKWQILNRLMPALLTTGEEFVKIGDPREALCYLTQGLLMARNFHLPRWFAEFHLACARLEILRADYNGMQAHLHRVKFVLTSESITKFDEMQPNDRDNDDHNDSADDFIKSKPMEVDEEGDHSFDLFDPCTSPASKKEQNGLQPAYWSHPVGCVCDSCVDISLQKLNIVQVVCSAGADLSQGETGPVQSSLHQVLEHFEHITQKSTTHLGQIFSTLSGLKPSKSAAVVPSVYQDLLVDICIQMMTLGIDTDNTTLFEEWTSKAEELVNVSKYPWMMDKQGSLAEILYLKSVSLLTLPRVVSDTDIDKLCTTLSSVKLKDVNPKDFATPCVMKKKIPGKPRPKCLTGQTSICQISEEEAKTEAPIRNRRGRKVPQLPPPVEETPVAGFRFFKSKGQHPFEGDMLATSEEISIVPSTDPFTIKSLDFDSEEENKKPKAKRQTQSKREAKVSVAKPEKETNQLNRRSARSKNKTICPAEGLPALSCGKGNSRIPVPSFGQIHENPTVLKENKCTVKGNDRKSQRNNKREKESTSQSVNLVEEKSNVSRPRRGKLASVTNCKIVTLKTQLPVYDFPDEESEECKSNCKTQTRSTAKRKPRTTRTAKVVQEVEQSRANDDSIGLPSIPELENIEPPISLDDEDIENARARSDSESDDDYAVSRRRSRSRRRSGGRGLFMLEAQEMEDPEVSRFSTVRREVTCETGDTQQIKPEGVCEEPNVLLGASVNHIESDEARGMAYLHQAYDLLSNNPPTPTYRRTCHALALMYMGKREPVNTAFYLSEAQNATFRHNAITNIARKLRKLKPGDANVEDAHLKRIKVARENLKFGKTVDEFRKVTSLINPDWTVCHITVTDSLKRNPSQMFVTRYSHDREPVTIPLSGYSEEQSQKLLQEYARIMKCNAETMILKDKVQWWVQRSDLDKELKENVKDIEDHWLGCWKGALLGSLLNTTDRSKMEKTVSALAQDIDTSLNVDVKLLEILVNSIHLLNEREVIQAVHSMCGTSQLAEIEVVVKKIKSASKELAVGICSRNPSILILDKSIQHLPWEVFPILRMQHVTRVPSLQFLHAHYQMILSDPNSVHQEGINPNKVYYIVNPEKNLPDTEAAFSDWFQRESKERGWGGVIGSAPSSSQFIDAVTKHDLFIYCGHGSGSKFFPGDSLKLLQCRAAVLLMGCSSGLLVSKGQLEATGLVLNYFLAGSPSVVANLWDVTDKDIDRFLKELLNSWLSKGSHTSLLAHMLSSRNICKLPYLIGAAPVVYGLPVRLVENMPVKKSV